MVHFSRSKFFIILFVGHFTYFFLVWFIDRVTLLKGLPKVINSRVSYCGFEAATGTMGLTGIVDTSNKDISDVLDVSLVENKEGFVGEWMNLNLEVVKVVCSWG